MAPLLGANGQSQPAGMLSSKAVPRQSAAEAERAAKITAYPAGPQDVGPAFCSILFENRASRAAGEAADAPIYLGDLNLDQVISSLTAGKQDYDLKPFFQAPLKDVDAVHYRHEVLHDMDRAGVAGMIDNFAGELRRMHEHLAQAQKLHYRYQRHAWTLDAAEIYSEAVSALSRELAGAGIRSRGFTRLKKYLGAYVRSDHFQALQEDIAELKAGLAAIRYCMQVKGSSVTVRKYAGEADYSKAVLETFEKFKRGAVKDYLVKYERWLEMNHVEAAILDMVARLYPEVFAALDRFCSGSFMDETIAVFEREVQFYVAYRGYMAGFRKLGLRFAYPEVSDTDKHILGEEAYDLALADKLSGAGVKVVTNDFELKGRERIYVVSGPNQGGKTTFARMLGQLHYLASLGCPVPGRRAKLFLFDELFTHFEREEDIKNLRGKLEDDLVRVHEMLELASPRSLAIMNETFSSTALQDARFLGRKVLERMIGLDMLGVYVTFIDELSRLGPQTVSAVSTVVPGRPAERTFKIMRRRADGRAHARSIAEKHRLTFEEIKARVPS
jgi:hypothetical protein